MSKFLILIEQTDTGYSAHSPDVPGCLATGATLDEVKERIREALAFHIDGLREEGLQIPRPSSVPAYVDVSAA